MRINKISLGLVITLAACVFSCSTASKKDAKVERPYTTKVLPNGLKVLIVRDDTLPYLSVSMLIKTGSAGDPDGQSGVASLTAELLDKGAKNLSATQIADAVNEIGTEFSSTATQDYTMLGMSTLSANSKTMIDLFSQIILEPAFPENEVERSKKIVVSELKRIVDEPDDFASIIFNSYLFGAHPYGRNSLGNWQQVQRLKKKDVVKFYLQNYRPNNAILSIVGNVNDATTAQLEQAFQGWTPRDAKPVRYAEVPQIQGVQIELVDKDDLKQSQIRLGHLGINHRNDDIYSVRVLNTVLGGAFASRLVEEVRIKRGLTYGISSSFLAQKDPGPFLISTFTRNDKVGETLKETLAVVKGVQQGGITSEELANAKAYIKGQFPKSIETAEKFAQVLLLQDLYELPENFNRDYLAHIEQVSLKDVAHVAAKYLKPENLKVLVFSPKGQTLEQLRPIGIVEVKSYREFL